MIKSADISNNCRFALIRRSNSDKDGLNNREYTQDDFESLKLIRMVKIPELERDVSQLIYRNNLELDYRDLAGNTFGLSYPIDLLRMSTFLIFTKSKEQIDINSKDIVKYLQQQRSVASSQCVLKQQQKIINICSPFGLNSRELFLNIMFKGIISNKFSPCLYLADLDGHLNNVEGSPIFDSKTGCIIGVRLPNVHSNNLLIKFATFIPINQLLDSLFKVQGQSTWSKQVKDKNDSFIDYYKNIIVKVSDSNLNSSGILVDGSRGLVLTNSHCIVNKETSISIKVMKQNYFARVLAKSIDQETIDIALLKLTSTHKIKNNLKLDLERVQNLKEGDTVYSVGFGVFRDLQYPSVYKGYVTRIVYHENKSLFIQHTAKTYPGQSGGGLFDKDGYLIGLIFKNSVLNISQENSVKLQLDKMCAALIPTTNYYLSSIATRREQKSYRATFSPKTQSRITIKMQNRLPRRLSFEERQYQFRRVKAYLGQLLALNMAFTFIINLIMLIYGILIIKDIGTFSHPYFTLILLTILTNLTNMPLLLLQSKQARNLCEYFHQVFRVTLLILFIQTLVSIFAIILPMLRAVVSTRDMTQGLIYLMINEGIRLIQGILFAGSLCYITKNRMVYEQLSEVYTHRELQRHNLRSQASEKIAVLYYFIVSDNQIEIVDKIPDADINDENVRETLEQTECVICLEVLWTRNGSSECLQIKLLSCQHRGKNYYHKVCLLEWFKVKQVCPICKDEKILETHLLEYIDNDFFDMHSNNEANENNLESDKLESEKQLRSKSFEAQSCNLNASLNDLRKQTSKIFNRNFSYQL
ncbi:serine family [Stylonychia lemnae]|uniref:Serine family n=1 Tax=Stylonychia lemnae TaxID=5949 RepID=A0A078AW55_STYLE|nr:serine family [Stylonychia lemnae]|eukprot:CDW86700.1 serine family [Stylonychia lemnae]